MNIILISTYPNPNYPSYKPCEERILTQLYEANKDRMTFKIIQSEPNEQSSLFKKFPLIYIDNKIIDNQSLLFFIRDLLYYDIKLPDNETVHFSYLLSFLKNNFREIYMKVYSSLKNNHNHYTQGIGFPLSRIQAFYEYFKSTKEKEFICLIIKNFIDEYQSIIPCEDISFFIDDKDINDNIFKLNELKEEDMRNIINKYSMNINSTKENNQNDTLQEMEAQKGWKNSLFSIGLFAGLSAIFLLLSLRKKNEN